MTTENDFAQDLETVSKIPIIPNLLNVICKTTGMGFAAVARVTETTWLACSVQDNIGFGLKAGGELEIKTTICNEIRQDHEAVIIDHVKCDERFKNHHTPAMYGFESYISVPIMRKDGSFFGTLCAIDPRPNDLQNPTVTNMFVLFADLISFHIEAIEELDRTENKYRQERAWNDELEQKIGERTRELAENNTALVKMNKELQSFAYISSHDLQEPLRKIQTFVTRLLEKEYENLSESGKQMFSRMQNSAERMQSLIDDLLAYSRTQNAERKFEKLHLASIINEVKRDLAEEIQKTQATIELVDMCEVYVIPFQFQQVVYNLLSNALKFFRPGHPVHIRISSRHFTGNKQEHPGLKTGVSYCHIRFADNGIGFEAEYNERIFELFQRLHDRSEYEGTGVGLAIVRKIIENHNGIINATGVPGQGATFDIYVPNEDLRLDGQ